MLSARERERNKQNLWFKLIFLSIFFLLLFKALIEEHCTVDGNREAETRDEC